MSDSSKSSNSNSSIPSLKINDLFDVAGLNVLVTGGGRGIGLMIAAALVQNGANVFISSRDANTIERVASQLTKQGPGKCSAFAADLSSMTGINSVTSTLQSMNIDKLHVLVNNSGASWGEAIETFSENGWNKVMDLNVKSLFFLTQKLLPLLRASATSERPARIINIGSVVGFHHQKPPTYSYDASKAAVHALTKKLAEELGPQITVNAIAPGFVLTKMSAGLPVSVKEISEQLPMKRTGGASDMAGVALMLASKAGAWMTGQIIAVDGGYLALSRL